MPSKLRQSASYRRDASWVSSVFTYDAVGITDNSSTSTATTTTFSKLEFVHAFQSTDPDKAGNPVKVIGQSYFCGKDDRWVSILDKGISSGVTYQRVLAD